MTAAPGSLMAAAPGLSTRSQPQRLLTPPLFRRHFGQHGHWRRQCVPVRWLHLHGRRLPAAPLAGREDGRAELSFGEVQPVVPRALGAGRRGWNGPSQRQHVRGDERGLDLRALLRAGPRAGRRLGRLDLREWRLVRHGARVRAGELDLRRAGAPGRGHGLRACALQRVFLAHGLLGGLPRHSERRGTSRERVGVGAAAAAAPRRELLVIRRHGGRRPHGLCACRGR